MHCGHILRSCLAKRLKKKVRLGDPHIEIYNNAHINTDPNLRSEYISNFIFSIHSNSCSLIAALNSLLSLLTFSSLNRIFFEPIRLRFFYLSELVKQCKSHPSVSLFLNLISLDKRSA
jgi:hypothetical protein